MTRGLYEIIRNVRTGTRPQMAIFSNKLWQLRSAPEMKPAFRQQDINFRSLKELLAASGGRNPSVLSSIHEKDRLVLSFVLTTSLLHFVNGPWLQSSFSSENICFLVSHPGSAPDITKPYLTANCGSTASVTKSRNLNPPHRFPDILSLGILLLEIARGYPIEFNEAEDRCYTALVCLDKWKKASTKVSDGFYQAIRACIEPKEFRGNQFENAAQDGDYAIREYIFRRVLFPLGEKLSNGYQVSLSTLRDEAIEGEISNTGSFDHDDEYQKHKYVNSYSSFKPLGY